MMLVKEIDPRKYDGVVLTEEAILHWFKECDAVWLYDGDPNPKKPHAELTSGMCSNGFFDCMRVLCHPAFTEILALQLAQKLREQGVGPVDWVIGSPYAAITFSYELARALGAIHGFAEKDPADPQGKKMAWRRMKIPPQSRILQVEELITTSGTFQEVRRAVREGNGDSVNFLPAVATLVHRPPKLPAYYSDDLSRMSIHVFSLIEREVWAVKPEECPLCKAGSRRVRPKSNWAELTGKA